MRCLLGLAALLFAPPAHGSTFYVNSEVDGVDAVPGDGVCATSIGASTLRAAIQETNALPGEDAIDLPAGVYVLTIGGTDEDAGATGDLDITDDLNLTGAGGDETIIDAGGLGTELALLLPPLLWAWRRRGRKV